MVNGANGLLVVGRVEEGRELGQKVALVLTHSSTVNMKNNPVIVTDVLTQHQD